MKPRRILSTILVLCMILCCVSVTALAADSEIISLGESKIVTVPAFESDYSEGKVTYSFTPDEGGSYVFAADYAVSDDLTHMIVLSAGDEENAAFDMLVFEAEAGQTYELTAEYMGLYTESVDYILTVEKCLPLESIELVPEAESGYADSSLYIDVVRDPVNSAPEEIVWETSDTSIVEISYVDVDFVELYLVAPGTATITATTVSGKTASVEITVKEVAPVLELMNGENSVSIAAEEMLQFVFTPEVGGYYTICVDDDMVGLWLSADSVSDGTNEYYVLEAGVTYQGELYSWEEEAVDCIATIKHEEDVVFLDPVAIEIIKLPDNTTYLKDTLQEMWSDDKLSGMELKVTWSDGSVSNWSYDDNLGFMGTGYVGGLLNEKEDGGVEVEVYVSVGEVEPVCFDLTVLDITAESITLVDDTPLEIVEHSCGLDLSTLIPEIEGWLYLPFAAYDREVVITFSDGSTVKAKVGDVVYGVEITCQNNQGQSDVVMRAEQPEGFWTKDSDNRIDYLYGDLHVSLKVQIVDSPVESVELVTLPEDTFKVDEEKGLIAPNGEVVESIRQLLAGMSLKVNYKDGTSKTFAQEEIEWRKVMGEEYPFVDGYPIGIFDGLFMQDEAPEVPGDATMSLEYKGVSVTYTIRFVEEFDTEDDSGDDKDDSGKTDVEINPETGDDFMMLAVLVISMMAAVVIIVKNEKLIG